MMKALYKATAGEALAVPMLVEIYRALGHLDRQQWAEQSEMRGASKSEKTQINATLVRDLVEHGATIDQAVYAAIPSGTAQEAAALKKAYQRLKALEAKVGMSLNVLSPAIVDPALARLPPKKKRTK